MRASLLLSSALVATAFVVGCEWTSSDGIAWDESYDNVNFSGTYPIGTILPASDDSGSTKVATGSKQAKGSTVQLDASNIQSANVTVFAKDGGSAAGRAEAPGDIIFSNPNYTGTLSEGGLVSVKGNGFEIDHVVVSYAYSYSVPAHDGAATAITVQQTGQNVTMTLNNGYTFTGKISGFDTNADNLQAASQVTAKYNVSGAHGSITGTLTSFAESRTIDGVLKVGGSSESFTGTIAGPGRSVTSSTTVLETAE